MSNIEVIAILKAKPESVDLVRNALGTLVAPTRAEPGCITYRVYASDADPSTFFTAERWRSTADFEAHNASEHAAHVGRVAGEHFDGAPIVHILKPLLN